MELGEDRIDDAVLALTEPDAARWAPRGAGFDWDALDRLHRKGFILDPVDRAESVALTEERLERSRALLAALLGKPDAD